MGKLKATYVSFVFIIIALLCHYLSVSEEVMAAVDKEGEATYAALRVLRPHNAGLLRTITAVDDYTGTTTCSGEEAYPVLDGVGTVHSRLGYTFSGSVKQGEPNGQGILRWHDGRDVVGVFAGGTVDGVGTLHWPNGDFYSGMLRRSVRHGVGRFVSDRGASRYEGNWRGGMRDGNGTQQYANGSVYVGQWAHNTRHGRGTLRYRTGDVYEGEWDADVPSGHGAMGWVDPSRTFYQELYVGEWRSGKPEGAGQSTYVTLPQQTTALAKTPTQLPVPSQFIAPAEMRLNVYVGEYRDGQRDGAGTFYYADGSCYQGRWRAGVKSGPGFFTSAVGEVRQELNALHGAGATADAVVSEQPSVLAVVPTVSPHGLGSLLESEEDLRLILHNLLQRYNATLKALFQHCCRLREAVALPTTPCDWWQQRLPGRATLVQCLAFLHAGHVIGPGFTIGDALRTAADVVRIEATSLEASMLSSSSPSPTPMPTPARISAAVDDIHNAAGTLNYRQFCEWLIRVAAQVAKGPGAITVATQLSALLDGPLSVVSTSTSAATSSPPIAAVFLPHSLQHSADVQAHLPALRRCFKELQNVHDGETGGDGGVSLRSALVAMSRTLTRHRVAPATVVEALEWLKVKATALQPNGATASSLSLAQELRDSAMAMNRSVRLSDKDASTAQSFVEFVETVMTVADLAAGSDGTELKALLQEIQSGLYAK